MEGCCLLCFQSHKEYVGYIKVNSKYWTELNVQNIIQKHLWSMDSIQPTSWVCNTCWKALIDFDNFYNMIEEQHKKFGTLQPVATIECLYESDMFYEQETENPTKITADVMPPNVLEIQKLEDDAVIVVNELEDENIYCDGQQNNSSLYNADHTRDAPQMNYEANFNSNIEEELLIPLNMFYENRTKPKRPRGRPRNDSKSKRGRKPKNAIKDSTYNNDWLQSQIYSYYYNTPLKSEHKRGRPRKYTTKYFEQINRLKLQKAKKPIKRPARKRKIIRRIEL